MKKSRSRSHSALLAIVALLFSASLGGITYYVLSGTPARSNIIEFDAADVASHHPDGLACDRITNAHEVCGASSDLTSTRRESSGTAELVSWQPAVAADADALTFEPGKLWLLHDPDFAAEGEGRQDAYGRWSEPSIPLALAVIQPQQVTAKGGSAFGRPVTQTTDGIGGGPGGQGGSPGQNPGGPGSNNGGPSGNGNLLVPIPDDKNTGTPDNKTTSVPEPDMLVLMLSAAIGLWLAQRRLGLRSARPRAIKTRD